MFVNFIQVRIYMSLVLVNQAVDRLTRVRILLTEPLNKVLCLSLVG